MGSVLKGNRYRLVDNRAFELPLSVKYILLKEDNEIAEYEISDNEKVKYKIITKYKEDMITPIHRPLTINDIHYFFSTRVFQDKTPFTQTELSLLGLEKYNVYDIIRKTRGVTPYDTYWLRFDGDNCDYDKARADWNEIMSKISEPPVIPGTAPQDIPKSDADIGEILNQHKVDIAAKFSEDAQAQAAASGSSTAPEPAPAPESKISSNTMSEDEIEALLMKSGLTDPTDDVFREIESDEESSLEAVDEIPAQAVVESVEPAEEAAPSGGKMSREDIEKMLAAASAPVEEAPAPAPEPEAPKSSGGKMSQEDIEKMLAAASAPVEEAPAPASEPEAPKSSGGKMSQEDIEKMLAAASAPVEEAPAPAPEPEAPKSSGGKMSQEDIEKMLAETSAAVQEPILSEPVQQTLDEPAPAEAPKPAEEAKPSGGKMSQADIEALLSGMKDDVK